MSTVDQKVLPRQSLRAHLRQTLLIAVMACVALAASHSNTFANTSEPDTSTQTTTTEPNKESTMSDTSTILLSTSHGDITIELDHKNAPVSAKNFVSYVESGHYDGVIFHRVIPNFMIQGGGFGIGMVQKPTQAPIVNEANNGLKNNKYTLAMARTNDPHSASSQFFINTKDNDFLNFSSETSQGWGYAVFGRVIDGFDVVDQIEKVATGQVGPHGDVPVTDVVIVKATKL